ncbi:MAG: hypothetical protein ABI790_14780 [Betaproteobacteria bacterium]
MNLTMEQLAEVLAGIAKAQQAVIDAIESESGGWKNTHLIPKLTTAANTRLATPRLMDVPSRVLLRSQTRVVMDVATITRLLHEAVSGEPVPAAFPTEPAHSPAKPFTPPAAAPIAAGAVAGAAAAAVVESTPAAGADDLSNFFDT